MFPSGEAALTPDSGGRTGDCPPPGVEDGPYVRGIPVSFLFSALHGPTLPLTLVISPHYPLLVAGV